MARLERIVIPKVECEKATGKEVIDFAENPLDLAGSREIIKVPTI